MYAMESTIVPSYVCLEEVEETWACVNVQQALIWQMITLHVKVKHVFTHVHNYVQFNSVVIVISLCHLCHPTKILEYIWATLPQNHPSDNFLRKIFCLQIFTLVVVEVMFSQTCFYYRNHLFPVVRQGD